MTHTLELPVYGFHCDAYGHVNNARWLEFFDAARNEMMQARGLAWLEERKIALVVKSAHVTYDRPARPGVRLTISSDWLSFGERSAVLRQVASSGRKTYATADIEIAAVNAESPRAMRLEGELLHWLTGIQQP